MAAVEHAPYGRDGSLLLDPDSAFEWRPNEPFRATLRLALEEASTLRGHVIWKDSRGRRYPMFTRDLLDVLAYSSVSQRVTIGWWIVTKRRNHYGICLLPSRETGTAETSQTPS